MTPFFSHPERVAKLHAEADAWIGTPFHPNGSVKGAGVSCQKLVGALMRASGFDIGSIPDGAMDWHGGGSPIERHLDLTLAGRFESILGTAVGGGSPLGCAAAPRSFQAGDIIGFWVGDAIKHVGVMVNPTEFVHVLRHSKVAVLRTDDATWGNRITRIWRPIE